MKTANPYSFAALKSRVRFSTVLFSLTLAPTRLHETPFSLRTSFCGSMTTSAVSLLSRSMHLWLCKLAAKGVGCSAGSVTAACSMQRCDLVEAAAAVRRETGGRRCGCRSDCPRGVDHLAADSPRSPHDRARVHRRAEPACTRHDRGRPAERLGPDGAAYRRRHRPQSARRGDGACRPG